MRLGRRLPVIALAVVGMLAIATLTATRSSAVVDGSPVAQWAFDEGAGGTAFDSIGALDGSLSGPSWISNGFTGSALRFDGVDDVVTVASDPTLTSPRMAVSLWVRGKAASPPADGSVILELGDRDCTGGDYALAVDGNNVELRVRDDQTNDVVRFRVPAGSMASLWDGEWHHVGMNYVSGDYGGASLLIDGNFHGGGTIRSLTHAVLDVSDLAIGRAARSDCGRPAFSGDIDDVRVFGDVMSRDGFGAMEPPIPTTTTIVQVSPLSVGTTGTVTVDIDPVPISGWIRVFFVDADAVEHQIGGREIEYWMPPPPDGRWSVGAASDWGGQGTLIVRSELGPPHVPSSASVPVTIAKEPVSVAVTTESTYVDGEPIHLGAWVDPIGPNVSPNGHVDLYDITAGPGVLIGSAAIVVNPSSSAQWVGLTLPPRSAGSYRVEARYLGSISHLPGSGSSDLEVLPALVTGDVVINGGAEVTSDPIVTVAVSAEGAIALEVSSDPTDIRRFYTIPYAPEITTWLTAPWYGDDADGVRTIWIKWADHLNRWSDWKTDTITLDRGLPTGTITIDNGAQYATDSTLSVDVPVPNPSLLTDVGLSTDGVTFTTFPYASSVDWTVPTADGPLTVYARWRDTAGRWSMTRSDSIVLDTLAPTGSIAISADQALTNTPTVTVSSVAKDGMTGVTHFELSNDGTNWTAETFPETVSWTLSTTNGAKTVWAKWQDAAGNWSAIASDTIVLDTVAPTSTIPTLRLPLPRSALVSGALPVGLAWSGGDTTSGIARFELSQSIDGAAWSSISTTLTSPSVSSNVLPGHTYRYLVRAVDRAGNIGTWVSGSTFRLTAYQESSSAIHWTGTWRVGTSTSFWRSHDRYATASGAKASLTFTGHSFAWVGSVGPTRGSARIYVNGILVKSISLYAAGNANRRILFATSWSRAVSRTITIRISGTAGHPRGDIDALLTW